MIKISCFIVLTFLLSCSSTMKSQTGADGYNEPYRPQIHFTPPAHWMNDPNGMVYFNKQYHLFYQYYPDSSVWGPMHWGHAVSKDLIHWKQLPIALYPDSLGYIFSGSAVVDYKNTSGFGQDGKAPLVAIFTNHDSKGEKAGRNDFQKQSIAYSLDEGLTWTKYAGNPVLQNPGIRDFRDPKVSWFEAGKKWIMTLATFDRVTFFSSPDLKNWTKESDFGKEFGVHDGAWECPDLFPLEYDGQTIWVLLVSINPGGPNGGSATMYFTGQFDGNKFTPYQTDTRWVDWGTDDYAGVTWSNTGNRRIFLGWMSNWQYANKVPTEVWRSATTIPRDLGIEKVGEKFMLTAKPVAQLNSLFETGTVDGNVRVSNYNFTQKVGVVSGPYQLHIAADKIASFSFTFLNTLGEKLVAGYDKTSNTYFIDRTKSGRVDFEKRFSSRQTAPRISETENLDLTFIMDKSSIEMFADNGLSVMTVIYFPTRPLANIQIQSRDNLLIKSMQLTRLKSIWK